MATATKEFGETQPATVDSQAWFVKGWLPALASLKWTVALFACSLVLVLVGTLAQDEMNMEEVKQRYFVSWIAQLHFDDWAPQSFFPHSGKIGLEIGDRAWTWIPFPGGSLIGLMLLINLAAAKVTSFKVKAQGGKLAAGILFLIVGFVVGFLVVKSGNDAAGLQGAPPISYGKFWVLCQVALGISAVGIAAVSHPSKHRAMRYIGYACAAILGATLLMTLVGDWAIGDSGLRIVWQLSKGVGVGLILMVGCHLLFGQQGGNLLLHIGVAVLMVGQFAFGDQQAERRVSLVEGESTNVTVDTGRVGLAFIQSSDTEEDVIFVPASRLIDSLKNETTIVDDSLPVNLRVLKFFPNSVTSKADPEENLATVGNGMFRQAVDRPTSGGANSEMNFPAAYVELLNKEDESSLGTFLFSVEFTERSELTLREVEEELFESITVGQQTYDVGLRFGREVKPFWIHLYDVKRENYAGTETPRDYRSTIKIVDLENEIERRDEIWMNNPLRYRGETFYQSSYQKLPSGKEWTSLQVVQNKGWLIPYVACSVIAVGMLFHFLGTLQRFISRRERETRREEEPQVYPIRSVVAGAGVAALIALYMLVPWQAMVPSKRDQSFDYYSAGKVPAQYKGRIMPLDAFAKMALTTISNKSSLKLDEPPLEMKERLNGATRMSAIQWLLESSRNTKEIRDLRMFRIDADEVKAEIGVERRKSKLYSLNEITRNGEKVQELINAAVQKDKGERSFKEAKLLELASRVGQFETLTNAFQVLPIEAMQGPTGLRLLQQRMGRNNVADVARIVPPSEKDAKVAAESGSELDWEVYANMHLMDLFQEMQGGQKPEESRSNPYTKMVEAYFAEEPSYADFNAAVDQQLALTQSYDIPGVNLSKISLERWQEYKHPSRCAIALFAMALAGALGFLATGSRASRNVVFGILVVACAVQTLELGCRIYITGRAPVINLYSAALFIGWLSVIFGLAADRIFKLGIGITLASVSGLLSLQVAYGLADGDTMPVLQAVLDTQFWLATHVVTVTAGYFATFVAGFLGIFYIFATLFNRPEKVTRTIYRIMYAATCFGILFSTIGTILGGLWADDSWGRFWGWDPKENGALLIVIWNALLLHARWGALVKGLGYSVLAIFGNVITAWSFFGTNELGLGFHAYGFREGMLRWLCIFWASQLLVMGIGVVYALATKQKPNQSTKPVEPLA
ncbi:Cytochrome c biogenesis protein CcsA [Stieleria bergensis]|uniref:Cytochrome c biogenesis protein CcsA n=1 Tax=Stieleria bergensis TaxID=2528025 RepID=A0A517SQK0_9BACT|nr:Cytochrome c biogenesis protein CcsA [Planctomycetes bacterium SV_7m_r]